MKVVIIGAGIGGLVTALRLHAAGVDAEVYEQADGIRGAGVGINALPHAVRELVDVGLLDRLDAAAIRPTELIYAHRLGPVIQRRPCGLDAGFAVPQFSLHRGRFQQLLADAVRERIGPDAIRTGHRLAHIEQDAGGVTARFTDRAGEPVAEAAADALIGADGIHSSVRESLFPQEGPPRWSGVLMWRGATEWPAFLDGSTVLIAGGTDAKLVVYPIAAGSTPDTRLTNWAVCVQLGADGDPPPRREDWSRPGDRTELAAQLPRFHSPFLDHAALADATAEIFEFPMCDRDPLPFWSRGRVSLLGDAAHPMYPMGSNGAGQAILDATCLAASFAQHADDPVAALRAYEAERLPATTEVVLRNRIGGPERVIDEVQRRAPEGFDRLEDVISPAELEEIVTGYQQLSGASPERVNRPG
ncbi:flavin-dependent oxidoreductase [Pseudonocardia humida]|uniref:Flavin-dependent oxidoreductase n=1 Tax=Pseudonocardia humida TaxID=2800819 RepID=A0ABT1A2Z9_9PSEU|nr:flavin-dependent oxidoreductase [Pseudonocardia humida]MCO1657290.1 flavin-dependent oxidoreductase [Pseudonocardia humida]